MGKKKKNKRKLKYGVEYLLDTVTYTDDELYIPKAFSLILINFIKLVNGSGGESHPSPVMHYRLLDSFDDPHHDAIANLCFRGASKTTLIEYIILYCAVHNGLPNFGKFKYGIYVSDTMENGVKKMRKRLELKLKNSEFLKKFIPKYKFTDNRWQFWNAAGESQVWDGAAVETGIRGGVELGERPCVCIFDDLISDKNSRSNTINKLIEEVIFGAIEYALDPNRSKLFWNGTPFNANDPLYKAIDSGAWYSNVYPVCSKFPCKKKDFDGAWDSRFSYKAVNKKYKKAKKRGKLDLFYRELMLRITSADQRLISDDQLQMVDHQTVMSKSHEYHWYITTDFANTAEDSADWSIILVWAVNHQNKWFLMDGICKKQTMRDNVDDLFNFVTQYRPRSVGIEISGQQASYLYWLDQQMEQRNIYFQIAKETESENSYKGKRGFKPTTKKIDRFLLSATIITNYDFYISSKILDTPLYIEMVDELTKVTNNEIRSKNDDFIDGFSQTVRLKITLPAIKSSKVNIVNKNKIREATNQNPWSTDTINKAIKPLSFESSISNYLV